MSVQKKAIKAIRAAAKTQSKKTTTSKPATKANPKKDSSKKAIKETLETAVAEVVAVLEAAPVEKKTEKNPDTARLEKRWRRATYGCDHKLYAKDARKQSREYVAEALKTKSVAEIEADIETIRKARVAVAKPSGAVKVESPAKKTKKSSQKSSEKQAA